MDGVAPLTIAASADANGGWGVQEVRLMINGVEVAGGIDGVEPFGWPLGLPPGAYTLEAKAIDYAGNEAISEAVLVGVDEPAPLPPPPEPTDESGEGDDGEEVGSDGEDGEDSSNADDGEAGDSKGCACGVTDERAIGGLFLFGLLGLVRRRR